ncbi:MAG: hypothetical protein SFU56_15240 [Capsulimonadales bacterium]|nr:hypothetical protein [Capsulimonadales bacterium]
MQNRIENHSLAAQARRRTQAGQSAIVAIIVLFLLLFIAAIFISIIAGNLKNTQVAANITAAGRFAEAGINYLDQQLTNSPEGADWRPVPDCAYGQTCTAISQSDPDYFWLKPYEPATGEGGFTRVPFGSDVPGTAAGAAQAGGRALVRITYQPDAIDRRTGRRDPLGRYIRLESVGRVGQINPDDPTTYGNTEKLSQRVELVAYKAIGLNEYVRNITNKDNKPNPIQLGAPFPIRDRDAVLSLESVYEGAVRVNGSLTFFGVNRFILNPFRNDALEVAGTIALNDVANNATAGSLGAASPTRVGISTVGLSSLYGPTADLNNVPIVPSGSPQFRTLGPVLASVTGGDLSGYALVRDNPGSGDTTSLPNDGDQNLDPRNTYQQLRAVARTAPPVIDNVIGPNGLTRYRALTRDSAPLAPRFSADNPVAADLVTSNRAGLLGWGQGLYINNPTDSQPASGGQLLDVGYSVRNDWINPFAYTSKNYWSGDYRYVPPAVTITLYPRYFTITASDGANYVRLPNGAVENSVLRYTRTDRPAPSVETEFLPNQIREGYPATRDPDGVPGTGDETAYYSGDFVIYAEGNVRIKGTVGGFDGVNYFKRHLTVVSNGTIYVDGNLLRDNLLANDTNPVAQQVRGQSTIALLAKEYITVNTTQFFTTSSRANNRGSETDNGVPAYFLEVTGDNDPLTLSSTFAPIFVPGTGFTVPGYLSGAANAHTPDLLLRHASAPGGSSTGNAADRERAEVRIALQINPNPGAAQGSNYYDFNNPGFSSVLSPDPVNLSIENVPNETVYKNDAFSLPGNALYPVAAANSIGVNNVLRIVADIGRYRLTRAAIAPADIRIEALMYAQEGSFFIIPGPWFNPVPDDSYENFRLRGYRTGARQGTPDPGQRPATNPLFPFYREPLDVRITFCGAINENLPAEIGDQGAWMEKWGWIPSLYGSTGLASASEYPSQGNPISTMHGINSPFPELRSGNAAGRVAANGITYQFDDRAVFPYAPNYSSQGTNDPFTGGPSPLRRNPYNPTQPLPFAPRLPVAPGLLYYGQSTVR